MSKPHIQEEYISYKADIPENRDFKGVWIPKDIWLDKRLSPFDKILLTEIESLDNEKGCWKGNIAFAEFMQCNIKTVTRSIAKLRKFRFISTSMIKTKTGKMRVIKCNRGVWTKCPDGYGQKVSKGNTYKEYKIIGAPIFARFKSHHDSIFETPLRFIESDVIESEERLKEIPPHHIEECLEKFFGSNATVVKEFSVFAEWVLSHSH